MTHIGVQAQQCFGEWLYCVYSTPCAMHTHTEGCVLVHTRSHIHTGLCTGVPFSHTDSLNALHRHRGTSARRWQWLPSGLYVKEEVDPGTVEGTSLRVLKYPHPSLRAPNELVGRRSCAYIKGKQALRCEFLHRSFPLIQHSCN
jgi:hypothetical protein